MVLSMTGFGRGKCENDDMSVTVEIRSVNHRFSDISIRIPRQFLMYEDSIKKIVLSKIQRGKVDVFVTIEGSGIVERTLDVDWSLFDQYIEMLNKASTKYSINSNIDIQTLTQLPELFHVIEKEGKNDELEEMLHSATTKAVEGLYHMRLAEGAALSLDIKNRLHTIQMSAEQLVKQSSQTVNKYRERLLHKVQELVRGILNEDDSRILTEVALFAEKTDISEEIQRLKSHCKQFFDSLNNTEETIGRKLDFLTQEMNREVNTIGSKSIDTNISQLVVEIKSEIEKIKEQVQNIE